ncbi:MAG: biotin/lipoyl-binding protein [Candidatus Pacebacteria bacterium]|nr:biotin/lipoyl-binding protein [Candidatus Paceibacterota bacterium]
MKNVITFLEKPKVIIPAAIIIAFLVGAFFYRSIGNAPVVAIPSSSHSGVSFSDGSAQNSVDLAFLRAGRLAEVSVNVGDTVRKGEVLASLDTSDVQGTLNQAKGALELAKAQYASLNVQYANAKTEQDVLVANAFRTLLSSNLIAVPHSKYDNSVLPVSEDQTPVVTGTYTCDTETSYKITDPYAYGSFSGYAFYTTQPLGSCGLFIQFPKGYSFTNSVNWVVDVPNTKSSTYAANKNAYDLAVATRDQVLKQLEANLGKNGSPDANVAQAAVDAAEGTYEAALATYNNSLIVAPIDGIVSFVDSHLKVGQSVVANKTLITLLQK